MKIYYYNGTLWKDVTALDSSFCEETIDRFNRISLDFVLPSEELVPELCHVTWRGEKYTLYTVPKVVKVSTREYRYTLILEGRYKELERTLVKDKLGRTKFVFTGRPDQYADLISGCIDGWSTGTCTTGDRTQVVAFSNNSLLDACRMVASKFETEVQLDGGKIAFGRVEKYKGDPLTLAYRQGLQKEITTEPDSKETALGRLYVMGGEHNIDPAKYGSRTLHLPKGGSLSVEGHTFRVDAAGRYISLEGDTRLNTSERALDATTIYPKRVGTISKVEQKGDEWDVIDETNPVDYTQYRVGGDVMRLEFQSGRLAGRSFDLTTKDDKLTGYVHTEKRFRLVRREIDGVLMPEPATFFPASGDKYAIFGCSLPDEYIKSAEAEMLSTAAKYMAERLETRVQYRAELDGLWAKKNWSTVAHKLTIGTIVRLEGAANDVRISSVRTSLNSPYTPRITFSNAPYMVGSLTTQIATIESAEVRTREETRQSFLSLQARTYEDTKVVREMIERLNVEGFTQAIKPETLQSMYAVIGSPALQFDFVRGGGPVPFSWSEGKGGTITIPGQSIRRKASGTTLEPGDKSTVTDIPALTYTLKAEEQQAYVYTELSPAPHFVISTKPLAISPDRLLVGLLNGEEGKRAFTTLYGFTEITPGQLKTDLIRSQDGKSYWDLLSGKFATKGDLLIGDPKGNTCLAYIDGVLYVKGLTVNVGSSSTTIEDALLEQERKAQKAYDEAVKRAKELDGEIQVGGRNLLRPAGYGHDKENTDNHRTVVQDGNGVLHWTQKDDSTSPYQLFTHDRLGKGAYTLSFKANVGEGFRDYIYFVRGDGAGEAWIPEANVNANVQIREGVWLHTVTYNDLPANGSNWINYYGVDPSSPVKEVTFWDFKLERGTVATDWTPAPEDVQAEIDAAKSSGGACMIGEVQSIEWLGYYYDMAGEYKFPKHAGDTVIMAADGSNSTSDYTWKKGQVYISVWQYDRDGKFTEAYWKLLNSEGSGEPGPPGPRGPQGPPGKDYSKEIKELQDGLSDANTAIDSLKAIKDKIESGEISLEGYPRLKAIYDAFSKGKTTREGGLIYTTFIALARALGKGADPDKDAKVTAYVSGQDGKGASMLAAGVKNFGGNNETAVSRINFDGSAKLGPLTVNKEGTLYLDQNATKLEKPVPNRLYMGSGGIFSFDSAGVKVFGASASGGFKSERVNIGGGGTSFIQVPSGNVEGLRIEGNLHVIGDRMEYNGKRVLVQEEPRIHSLDSEGAIVYISKDDSIVLVANESLTREHCQIVLPNKDDVKEGWMCKVTTIGVVTNGSITFGTKYSSQKMIWGSDRQASSMRDYTEKTNVIVAIRIKGLNTNNGIAYWVVKEIKSW